MLSSGEPNPGKFLYCHGGKRIWKYQLFLSFQLTLSHRTSEVTGSFIFVFPNFPHPQPTGSPEPPRSSSHSFGLQRGKSQSTGSWQLSHFSSSCSWLQRKHFWLKNKLEFSVETSNIFPESTIKIIRSEQFRWSVRILGAKACYSFVYCTKNLKSAPKSNIFQKIKQASLCCFKSQEEASFVIIESQTNIYIHLQLFFWLAQFGSGYSS